MMAAIIYHFNLLLLPIVYALSITLDIRLRVENFFRAGWFGRNRSDPKIYIVKLCDEKGKI